MASRSSRRQFVAGTTAGAISGTFLPGLPPVTADEARKTSEIVRFGSGIESLVRLIEETPREKLLEKTAAEIHAGRSYREVLAALLLAGIRNVQPRPSVGFKFHCVLVVNSCHLASLSGPDEDRWLPIFWALDYFKSSQADEARRSGWKMKPVRESLVPDALHAKQMFVEAMETWDVEKADAATAGLVRTAGATEVFNLFAQYAARDYRSIGHKAIYLANSWRALQVIGWEFAEPVLRSLAFALLNHSGESRPDQSNHKADLPWRKNAELLERIPENWLNGKADSGLTASLIDSARSASETDLSVVAAEGLKAGVSPQSIWDAAFVGAGELLMKQPGIIGLHGLTTANAVHYLYSNVRSTELRQRLLLQGCSFGPMFRESAKGRGKLADRSISFFERHDGPDASLESVLQEISKDRTRAAGMAHAYLSGGGSAYELIAAARRLLFLKGRDAHDYKFSSAVLEDYEHVSPAWRDRFLALSVFNLKGSGHSDSGIVQRTRAALDG